MESLKTTQRTTPQCLWMQAGVVPKKFCRTDYDCTACRFDRALNRVCRQNRELLEKGIKPAGEKGALVFWKDRLNNRPLSQRPCIHHMKGKISFRTCPKAYHCTDCEFDQYFDDHFKVHAVIQPMAFQTVDGVMVPSGYYLSAGHTWIKIEDQGVVRIGIDDFAARLLGEIDSVSALLMGKTVQQGRAGFTLFKNSSPVRFSSPVTGVITQVNPAMNQDPEQITTAPYTRGWVCMVHCPDLKNDLKQLLFMEEGLSFMAGQVKKLHGILETSTRLKAADGGYPVFGILDHVPADLRDRLIQSFIDPGL
jgi:glycine cleavage system H lipoate-binding protein